MNWLPKHSCDGERAVEDLTEESLDKTLNDIAGMVEKKDELIAARPTKISIPRYHFDTDESYIERVGVAMRIIRQYMKEYHAD